MKLYANIVLSLCLCGVGVNSLASGVKKQKLENNFYCDGMKNPIVDVMALPGAVSTAYNAEDWDELECLYTEKAELIRDWAINSSIYSIIIVLQDLFYVYDLHPIKFTANHQEINANQKQGMLEGCWQDKSASGSFIMRVIFDKNLGSWRIQRDSIIKKETQDCKPL
jgi:hypothetical protein